MRFCTLAIIVLLLSSTTAVAEDDNREWMKFFAGNWALQGESGESGELQWKLAANGNAVIGSGEISEASAWILGWDAAEKRHIHAWFAESGDHGRILYEIVDQDTLRGPAVHHGKNRITKAVVTLKKTSQDRFTVEWKDVTVNGEESKDFSIVLERK